MSNTQEPYFKAITLGHYLNELPKSTLPASEAKENGHYPFYCSSSVVKYCNTYIQEKPTVLMGTGGVASVNFGNDKFAYSTDTWAFRSNDEDEVKTEYIYRLLQLKLPQIDYRAFEGSGLKHLRKNDVKKLTLGVPVNKHLTEKLLYIFRNIDTAIEKTEALIEKYQQIKAGLMHDLFTRGIGADGKLRPPREEASELYQETPIGWIPKDWSHTAFVESIELLTDYHANGAYEILKDHVELLDYPDFAVMIRTTNFEQNDFDNDVKYITRKAFSFLSKSVVYPSDILMNKIANPGVSYLMPDLGVPVSLGMNLFLIRLKEGISPKFIHEYLCFKEEYVKSFSNGTGTKTITKDAVRSLIISMPNSPDEITLISDTLACMSEKIAKEKTYLKSLNNQKSGLMHDLLTGKVQLSINNSEEAHV